MIKSLFTSSFYSGLGSVFAFTLTIVLAHNESREAFADLLYSIAWGLIFAQMIDFGAEQCLTHFNTGSKIKFEIALPSVYLVKVCVLLVLLSVVLILNIAGAGDVPISAFLFVVPGFYFGPIFEMRSLVSVYAKILLIERVALLVVSYLYLSVLPLGVAFYCVYFLISLASICAQVRILRLGVGAFKKYNLSVALSYAASYWTIVVILLSQVSYGHISRLIIESKLGVLVFASVSLAFQIVNAISIIQTQVDRHLRPKIMLSLKLCEFRKFNALTVKYLSLYLFPLFLVGAFVYLFAGGMVFTIFGSKWVEVSESLRCLSPMVVTVAVLRFLDIVVVGLDSGRFSMLLNVSVALVMSISLFVMPVGRVVDDYLFVVVGFQILHITALGIYLFILLKRRMRSLGVT